MIDSNTSLILGEGKCRYAFFPGCCLCENEPEIVVKAYDSLRFQNADTALILLHCGDVADVKAACNKLGRPEFILCCPRCVSFFSRALPEIPAASLYDKLIEYGISGGCNSVDYCLHESVCPLGQDSGCACTGDAVGAAAVVGAGDAGVCAGDAGVCAGDAVGASACAGDAGVCAGDAGVCAGDAVGAVAQLARDMGATLHTHEKNSPFPYLVNDIAVRNQLKSSNHDAAHILELVYGMGASNTHLIHEHEHEDGSAAASSDSTSDVLQTPEDCNGDCSSCSGCPGQYEAPQPLPDENQRRANLEELVQVVKALYL
ncbi:MAG: hypothetical protein ACI4KL_06955 [Lentihominibacter sp.]